MLTVTGTESKTLKSNRQQTDFSRQLGSFGFALLLSLVVGDISRAVGKVNKVKSSAFKFSTNLILLCSDISDVPAL